MNSSKLFFLVGTFKDVLQIPIRNGKLISSLTILTLLSYSFLYLSNVFSIKPLLKDLLMKETFLLLTSPKSNEFANLLLDIKVDVRDFLGIQTVFTLAYLAVSLFSVTATISASSFIHRGKSLTLQELLPRMARSALRPAVTSFYITLFGMGYTCLYLGFVVLLGLILDHPSVSHVSFIALGILATIFYTYLAVVWILSLVVSVLEETCYGIEALGKAEKLVKGMRLQGFVLNLVSSLVSIGLVQGLRLLTIKQSLAVQLIIGLIVMSSLLLVKIFTIMAYTVFYYQCKKSHGEEVELQGNMEYSKIPNSPLVVGEDFA